MAKPSSTRKVARVARTGGGRTARGQRSWFFPTLMIVVSILGVFLIGFSRSQRAPDLTRPRIGTDHWHSAIGFDICGTFAPPLADNGQDPLGIHGHGDGVVHTHPFSRQSSGQRAVLRHYLDTMEIELTDTELKLPGQDGKKNGQRCGDKEAEVQVKVWGTRAPTDQGRIVTGDPASIRLGDSQLITVAFVPKGSDIRRPPTEAELDRLTDVGPTASSTSLPEGQTTLPPATTPETAPPSSAP